ncbi:P-loop containing nucleoside triphosphate hydrolase protein [Mycena alexandri]|uniref:P-loop containing nucleoside triphosphate hydrolase protein n=1 Tax=Mycena alexandri TaxID=1745969 RepID=A0AAD6S9J1_9AGAR|nr:P-loop containing nucleoside triphosphate hydrolase protein [Mycena alexandri]
MNAKAEISTPKVPMDILVLGFCRTGTASMRAALSVLGYGGAHHIGRVMHNPEELAAWNAAIDSKFQPIKNYNYPNWDQLLGEFKVVADVPGILFAEELIQAYPDARVILTTRDPDRWWKSMRNTLLVMLDLKHTRLARWVDPHGLGRFVPFARRNLEILLGPLDTIDEATAKMRYVQYNDNIRQLVPPGRLLEYEMGQGWERLCGFLGKEVPRVEFPHKNDAKMILEGSERQIWGIYRRAVVKLLTPTAILMAVMFAVYARGI